MVKAATWRRKKIRKPTKKYQKKKGKAVAAGNNATKSTGQLQEQDKDIQS